VSIAAAASFQQRPVKPTNTPSLLSRSPGRKMHSKVVSECYTFPKGPKGQRKAGREDYSYGTGAVRYILTCQ
jgi:hypothetical protein